MVLIESETCTLPSEATCLSYALFMVIGKLGLWDWPDDSVLNEIIWCFLKHLASILIKSLVCAFLSGVQTWNEAVAMSLIVIRS